MSHLDLWPVIHFPFYVAYYLLQNNICICTNVQSVYSTPTLFRFITSAYLFYPIIHHVWRTILKREPVGRQWVDQHYTAELWSQKTKPVSISSKMGSTYREGNWVAWTNAWMHRSKFCRWCRVLICSSIPSFGHWFPMLYLSGFSALHIQASIQPHLVMGSTGSASCIVPWWVRSWCWSRQRTVKIITSISNNFVILLWIWFGKKCAHLQFISLQLLWFDFLWCRN